MPTRLNSGEARYAEATKTPTGVYRVAFSVRTHGDTLVRNSGFGATPAAAKRAARQKVTELLQTGSAGAWKPSSKLDRFINDVSRKAISDAKLRPDTVKRYLSVLRIVLGECGHRTSTHPNLSKLTIASGLNHDVLDKLLREIADVHGSENAHHALSVLKKYVVRPARSRGLITVDPLEGFSVKMLQGQYRGATAQRDTDATLSESDYWRVVDYLLGRDGAPLPSHQPNKGSHNYVRQSGRQRAINARDQLLLAAGTGLRANEISTLRWADVLEKDGRLYVTVRAEVSKTKKARVVPVLDELVPHFLERRDERAEHDVYVIGSPENGKVQWHQSGRDRALAALFQEIAEALGLDILERDFRAHGFRHTLSSIWAERGVDVELRARWFGHTVAVNQSIYTDLDSLDRVAAAMRRVDTKDGRHLAAV